MEVAHPVLVVEDDWSNREYLMEVLEGSGFTVSGAGTAEEARKAILDPTAHWDAVLLDVGLPDGDGREVCAWMRKQGFMAPVLMLTGARDAEDVISGLEAGANDYIKKPYRTAELTARLRRQLRIHDENGQAALSIGPWLFDPSQRHLLAKDRRRKVPLTAREAAVLNVLVRAGGEPVERAHLLDIVWGYNRSGDLNTHTVQTHVYRLRRKMEQDPNGTSLLLTEGTAYRVAAEAA
jgi:DNA-binding response OmpR family regulator